MTANILPLDPLSPNVIRLAFDGPHASLAAFGGPFLAVLPQPRASRSDTALVRYVLHLLPTTPELANAAFRVATGEMVAKAIPKPRESPPLRPESMQAALSTENELATTRGYWRSVNAISGINTQNP